MNRFTLCLCFFAIVIYSCRNRNDKNEQEQSNKVFISKVLADKSNNLVASIRDGKLDRDTSIAQFSNLLKEVTKQYNQKKITPLNPDRWIFPIKGYTPAVSIGGIKDEGYIPGRYDFFDGNEHKGHPALDLFISDENQDCVDDITKNPIDILSMTGGIVLATETSWDTASPLRGGKYIWVYDPVNKFLIYYAHNNTLNLEPGQIIKPGDKIATCGRSGLNAFKKRSPTHLHIMLLKLDENNYPKPVNPYNILINTTPL